MNVLMLSVLLMGVGYANWEGGFEVSATVNAGVMAIDVDKGLIGASRYMSAEMTDYSDSNDISIDVNDIYPGGTITYDFTVKNMSTMGIELVDLYVSLDSESDSGMYDYFEVGFSLVEGDYKSSDIFLAELTNVEIGLLESVKIYVEVVFDPNDEIETNEYERQDITFIISALYEQYDN